MNSKKIFYLLFLCFFMTAFASYAKASPGYDFSAEVLFSTYTPCSITHTAITSVSKIDGVLNAKVKVHFGSFTRATAEMLYYVNGDSVNVSTVTKGAISHLSDFYITKDSLTSYDSIDYQIKITVTDANNTTAYGYWPSSSTYQHAVITSSSSAVVSSTSTTTITLGSGDQSLGDTQIVISSGSSVPPGTEIIITQLPIVGGSGVSGMHRAPPSASNLVAKYLVTPIDVVIAPPAVTTFSYGTVTAATKFILMRSADDATWTEVPITSTNNTLRTITFDMSVGGYYAIYASNNLKDNEYRPARRVITKKGIEERGAKFEFNNLSDGDSVSIYNINGKKIRTIRTGTLIGFEWDGRKDNGDWAESGTYIYQIKVQGKSKLISGTIAFVK